LLLIGSDEASVGCDNFSAQKLIGSKTSYGAEGRVATTRKISTSNTNVLLTCQYGSIIRYYGLTYATFSTNSSVALTVSCRIQLLDLNAGTKLEGRASITASTAVVLGKLDVL
jgi:hypothetical protein